MRLEKKAVLLTLIMSLVILKTSQVCLELLPDFLHGHQDQLQYTIYN